MTRDMTALVVFTDVRGFTKWAEANEVFANLDHFVTGFLQILRQRFPQPRYELKPLGDGALVVSELPEQLKVREVTSLLSDVLTTSIQESLRVVVANFVTRRTSSRVFAGTSLKS